MAVYGGDYRDEAPLPKNAAERKMAAELIRQYEWALETVQDGLASQIERRTPEEWADRPEKYKGIKELRTALKALAYSGEVNVDALSEGSELVDRLVRDEHYLAQVVIRHTDPDRLTPFAQECIGVRDSLINLNASMQDMIQSLTSSGRDGPGAGSRVL